ncbi:MAG: hypothetical protein K6G18_08965 [Treponema sp.]|nr:hypothetical protein [Treponema sp.]
MNDDFTIELGITTANGKAADDPGIPWAVNIPKVINMVTVSRCDNAGELEAKLQKKDPTVKKINNYCYSCKMGDGYYDICINNEKVSARHCGVIQ